MLIEQRIRPAAPDWPESVVCIGTFDGVHLGHQAVMKAAVAAAAELGLPAGVVTFDRNPLELVAPERCPLPVASWRQNLAVAEGLGMQFALLLSFTEELRQLSAQDFLNQALLGSAKARHAVVGADFAMGKGRQGTVEWLSVRMPTTVVQPVLLDGVRVSSTAIRAAVLAGDMKQAERLLGRPFEMEGVVVKGQQLGRQLGYPTANLATHHRGITPGDGVYAAVAEVDGHVFPAAASIGSRPTVGDLPRAVEAYLLDYGGGSLYGRVMRLRFGEMVRPQERFDSMEALVAQIAADVERVRDLALGKTNQPRSGVIS